MIKFVSIIIPTYNPNQDKLNLTIKFLEEQTLPNSQWELIIIDNNSNNEITVNCSPVINYKIINEPQQGLTHARLAGFKASRGELIVMVDDDNLLKSDYLENVLAIFNSNASLGAAGGKILPAFDTKPEPWLEDFYELLAIRDLGKETMIAQWNNTYPKATCYSGQNRK